MPDGNTRKAPRNSRPLRPRPLAQRKLRVGLPATVAVRVPPAPKTAAGAAVPVPEPPAPAPAAPPAPERAVAPPTPEAPAPRANGLALKGDYWEVRYEGRSAIIADCRGMRYLALLIAQAAHEPRPLHACELVALASGEPPGPIALESKIEVLDAAARTQLARRLEDIAAERDRACAVDDLDTASALDEEFERIVRELRHAESGGQRGRRGAFADAGERARKAVGKAIAEAVARIAAYKEVAACAAHFDASVRKGQWLSYSGDVRWQIDFTPPLPRG
jgi:hypothetical protein